MYANYFKIFWLLRPIRNCVGNPWTINSRSERNRRGEYLRINRGLSNIWTIDLWLEPHYTEFEERSLKTGAQALFPCRYPSFFYADYRCTFSPRCSFPVIYSPFPFPCFSSMWNQRNQSTSFQEECTIYFKQKKKKVRKFSWSKEQN